MISGQSSRGKPESSDNKVKSAVNPSTTLRKNVKDPMKMQGQKQAIKLTLINKVSI